MNCEKTESVTSHDLYPPPSPLSQTVTLSQTPPPWSVTYFMDGPLTVDWNNSASCFGSPPPPLPSNKTGWAFTVNCSGMINNKITRWYTADAVWNRHPSGQPTWHDVTVRDVTWHDVTQCGMTWHDLTWLDIAWNDVTWHDVTFSRSHNYGSSVEISAMDSLTPKTWIVKKFQKSIRHIHQYLRVRLKPEVYLDFRGYSNMVAL